MFNKNLTNKKLAGIRNRLTFVYTNIVDTNVTITTITNVAMKIEDIIKSENMTLSKRAIMNVMYAHSVVAENISDVMKGYDLSPEQFNVLRILRGQKGKPANMGIIQDRMIAKTSNTTRLVDKLLLKELVNRKVCPGNRRQMEITITEKGLELLKELDPKVDEHEAKFANNLTIHEQEQLINLLEKYRTI